jgi:polysaccharide biosynthesis transport protein
VTSVPGSRSPRSGRRTTRKPDISAVTRAGSGEPELGDGPIETGHYVEILRRNRRLIALIAVGLALAAYGLALLLPDTYRSTARILMDSSVDPLGPSDADSVARRLVTAEQLVMTPRILALAARRVPGESARSLEEKVEATADPEANIIDVTASDEDQARVASIANAVATAFIRDQRRVTRDNVEQTRAILRSRLEGLGTSSETASQRDALAAQLGELELRTATADLVFRLVERAERPDGNASLDPLGVALLALIAGLVIAVLVVLGRDHLKPQITDAHELSHLTGSPVVARVSARIGDRKAPDRAAVSTESDAFRTLRGRVGRLLDPSHQHVVLVTSPVSIQGKDAVSAGLARALAETGHRTLFVSTQPADANLLATDGVRAKDGAAVVHPGIADRDGSRVLPSQYVATLADRTVDTPVAKELSILVDGHSLWDQEHGLGYETMRAFSKALRGTGYKYVVIDAPPLLETNDSLIFADAADDVVVVAELKTVTRTIAVDTRDALHEMNTRVLGLIIIDPQSRRQGRRFAGSERPEAATTGVVWPWWTTTPDVSGSRDSSRSPADVGDAQAPKTAYESSS